MKRTKNIYIFSNSTGETAERVIRATLAQFDAPETKVFRKSYLKTLDDIRIAVADVAKRPGLIVYTLMNRVHVAELNAEAERRGLESFDVITPIIERMEEYLGLPAKRRPGVIYKVDEDYLRRLEAVNFTVKHDDGQSTQDLEEADIVLIGVSRTSKTPLSMYLAGKGYKVANIPLVEGLKPPEKLFKISQDRVIGLTIDVQQLINVRESRMRNMRQSIRSRYTEYETVESELLFSKRLYRQNPGWMVVDMTNKAIEEAAAEIMKKYQ
ncbi:MAG: kinase/pyrophosphorylase [Deltaproteobacteria bacterium]|nr:kinase/pyrophosphorylase [Deltaproteobacteria bacterium]